MKHLTLQERKLIERELQAKTSFRQIAKLLEKHPSTISREVTARRIRSPHKPYGRVKNACIRRKSCYLKGLCDYCLHPEMSYCSFCDQCNDMCPSFEEERCPDLARPPYVCNACLTRKKCTLRAMIYQADAADKHYREQLSELRQGFCLTGNDFLRIDALVGPRLRNGQSVYAIVNDVGDELPCGISTIYRLVAGGEIEGVQNIHLPRKVRLKPRKNKRAFKIDARAREGRRMEDYERFIDTFDYGPLVEMDTIEGRKGGAVLLSLRWPAIGLHLLFWRQANTAKSVQKIFDDIYQRLGHERFERLFGVILTDNGPEFSNPAALEFTPDGTRRTHLFYCNPGSPQEKPSVERGHAEFRRILPKGTSFDGLDQEYIRLVQDHVNSYATKKLNGASPYATFSQLFDDSYARDLGWTIIEPAWIILTPELVKK